jgi:hypothetical protein
VKAIAATLAMCDDVDQHDKAATPGPWRLDSAIHDAELLAVKYVSEHGMNFYIADQVGGRRKGESFHDKSECEANATLIAALRNAAEELVRDARRYRSVRRGQHWSVINGIGDELRADALDAAIDAAIAQEQP